MIAVAKGLLGGIETTVASATKKDGSSPPFSDTFQQVSANHIDEATKITAQPLVRANRASRDGKKAGDSSSASDSAEQIAGGGRAASAKTDGGGTSASAVPRVVDEDTASAGEEVLPATVKIAEVTEEQGGANDEIQARTVPTVTVQPFVNTTVAQAESSAPPSIMKQASGDDSRMTGNTMQNTQASLVSRHIVPKLDENTNVVAPVGVAAAQSTTSGGKDLEASLKNTFQVSGQASTPVLLASVDAENLAAGATISGRPAASTLPRVESASVAEGQATKSGLATSEALAKNFPIHEAKERIQTLTPGHPVKSLLGSTSTKTVVPGLDQQSNNQTLSRVDQIAIANQAAPFSAIGSTVVDVSGLASSQAVLPVHVMGEASGLAAQAQVRPDGEFCSEPRAAATSIGSIVQGSEIVPKTDGIRETDKLASRHADGAQVSGSVTAASDIATAQSVVAGTNAPAPIAIANVPVSVASIPVSDVSSSPVLVTPSSSRPTSFPIGGTAVVADRASALHSEEPVTDATQVSVSGAVAASPSVPNDTPGIAAGDGLLSQRGVVAAASSLVKNAQPHGVAPGSTSVAKERKGSIAETKSSTASSPSTQVEAGPIASIAHPAISASASSKPGFNDHQIVSPAGGQSNDVPGGNAESMGLGAQSQVVAVAGPSAPAAAPIASLSVNGKAIVANASAAPSTSLPGTDHGLSPMAHTTLAATPTVLEVGVPGGTQGWLKIRAEIGEGGVVQASMSASTHAGQDALRRDLPAMTAFLESEHVPVNLQVTHGTSVGSLSDASGLSKEGGFDPGSGLGQSLNQNANSSTQGEGTLGTASQGTGTGQNGSRHGEADSSTSTDARVGVEVSRAGLASSDADWSTPAGYGSGSSANGGNWLNVIA